MSSQVTDLVNILHEYELFQFGRKCHFRNGRNSVQKSPEGRVGRRSCHRLCVLGRFYYRSESLR